jgi:hypothetical protein
MTWTALTPCISDVSALEQLPDLSGRSVAARLALPAMDSGLGYFWHVAAKAATGTTVYLARLRCKELK